MYKFIKKIHDCLTEDHYFTCLILTIIITICFVFAANVLGAETTSSKKNDPKYYNQQLVTELIDCQEFRVPALSRIHPEITSEPTCFYRVYIKIPKQSNNLNLIYYVTTTGKTGFLNSGH